MFLSVVLAKNNLQVPETTLFSVVPAVGISIKKIKKDRGMPTNGHLPIDLYGGHVSSIEIRESASYALSL